MGIAWGLVVVLLSLLAWGGQTVVALAPERAVKLGLAEAKSDVEAAFWADIRGEALADFLTLWTLLVAGVLLIMDHSAWAYFGLVGGGMYAYFAVRGILARAAMRRDGLRVGSPHSVRVAFTVLTIWGVVALITVVAAATALAS